LLLQSRVETNPQEHNMMMDDFSWHTNILQIYYIDTKATA